MIPSENLAPATPPQDRGINIAPPAELYRSNTIAPPEADGTVRAPAGHVVVQVALDPPLITKQGDNIIFSLVVIPGAQCSCTTKKKKKKKNKNNKNKNNMCSGSGQILIRSPAVTFHI